MKTILIAPDLHGDLNSTKFLFEQDFDELWSVGDLIDYNPNSHEVLQMFMNDSRANLVLGNHELKAIKRFPKIHPSEYGKNSENNKSYNLTKDEYEYLIQRPVYKRLAQFTNGKWLTILHGGLIPGYTDLNRIPEDTCVKKTLDAGKKINSESWTQLLYSRFIRQMPDGSLKHINFGDEVETDKYWAEYYNKEDGDFIICGHQPTPSPRLFNNNCLLIDTGVKMQHMLTWVEVYADEAMQDLQIDVKCKMINPDNGAEIKNSNKIGGQIPSTIFV